MLNTFGPGVFMRSSYRGNKHFWKAKAKEAHDLLTKRLSFLQIKKDVRLGEPISRMGEIPRTTVFTGSTVSDGTEESKPKFQMGLRYDQVGKYLIFEIKADSRNRLVRLANEDSELAFRIDDQPLESFLLSDMDPPPEGETDSEGLFTYIYTYPIDLEKENFEKITIGWA